MSEVQTPETPAMEQTPSQPASIQIIGEDGAFTPEYLSSLPDGLGEHSSFQKYKTAEDYFKGAINSQKLNGQKMEDFWNSEDPEHIEARRQLMGIPNEASEYEFDAYEVPEGMNKDMIDAKIDAAREKFKELGLSKEQANALIQWDIQGATEQWNQAYDSNKATLEKNELALREEWKGEAYDSNMLKTKNALEYLGLEKWIENPAMGNNPEFIKDVFMNIVPLVADDTIIEARQKQSEATLAERWDAQWEKMQKMDKNDPAYEREIRIMEEISSKMN
jgi:hypothetical protein